jgi:exosortase/archaeosortase family protein
MAERKRTKRKKERTRILDSAERPVEASRPPTHGEKVRSRRIGFAIAFALSCIVLYAIIQVLPPSFTKPINENTAWTLGLVLNTIGIPVSTANNTVSEGELAFRIIPDCTAIFTAGLFLSFVIFYPATLRDMTTGLLIGIPTLYLANLARLAATFMITRYDRRLFDVVHVYLGQVFTIFVLILVCVTWLRWLRREESKQSIALKAAGFIVRFAVISGGLFLLWTQIHNSYIWLLDRFMIFGFSLFGHSVALARHTVFYYETFSVVGFTSLVLAAQSTPWLTKIRGLAAGFGFFFFIHLFHRIDNALMAHYNFTAILPVDLTLLVVGQYLLPVLLLIFLLHYQKKMKYGL